MKINYQNRIFGLDVLRALAIICVVIGHIVLYLGETSNLFTQFLSLISFFGVEIFFVLSGFLIGNILYKSFVLNDFSKKTILYFWIRRWFRTLPNYYLILLINFIIYYFFYNKSFTFFTEKNIWEYLYFFQNFYDKQPNFFGESWSLSIEEYSYILAPLIFFFGLSIFKKNKQKTFLVFVICTILFFTYNKINYQQNYVSNDMNHWNLNLKALVIYRIDAIFYGMIASWLFFNKQFLFKKYRYLFLFISFIILLIINMIIPLKQITIENSSLFWNVLYLPLQSIIVLFAIPYFYYFKEILYLKPTLTFISIISYSLYLTHITIGYTLVTLSTVKFEFNIIIQILLYFIFTFISSYLLYRYYEKPMTNLRDSETVKKWVKLED